MARLRLVLLANLVLASMASAALADTGGVWRTVAPLQTARQELGAAAIGGSVYVVGGLLRDPNLQATGSRFLRLGLACGLATMLTVRAGRSSTVLAKRKR